MFLNWIGLSSSAFVLGIIWGQYAFLREAGADKGIS